MTRKKIAAGVLAGALVVLLLVLTMGRESRAVEAGTARVSHVTGRLAVHNQVETAATYVELNSVVQEGDTLWTDSASRAEIELARGAWLRLSETTKLELLSLGERPEVRLWNGALQCQVKQGFGRPLVVRTPDADLEVQPGSVMRVDLNQGGPVRVSTSLGSCWVQPLQGQRVLLKSKQRCTLEAGRLSAGPLPLEELQPDPFDRYADQRLAYLNRYTAPEFLEEPLIGAHELYDRGTWVNYGGERYWRPDYEEGWRPYSDGYWSHVENRGLSWVDEEPWGYTTSHYGNWAYLPDQGWCWNPDDEWAPAHVAWSRYENGDDDYIGWAPIDPLGHPCDGWDTFPSRWDDGDDWDDYSIRPDDRAWSFVRQDDFFYSRGGYYDDEPDYYRFNELDVVDVNRFAVVQDVYRDCGVPRYPVRGFAVAPNGWVARDTVLRVERRIPRRRFALVEDRWGTPWNRHERLYRETSPVEALQRYRNRRLRDTDIVRGEEGRRRFRMARHRTERDRGWFSGRRRDRDGVRLANNSNRAPGFLRGERQERREQRQEQRLERRAQRGERVAGFRSDGRRQRDRSVTLASARSIRDGRDPLARSGMRRSERLALRRQRQDRQQRLASRQTTGRERVARGSGRQRSDRQASLARPERQGGRDLQRAQNRQRREQRLAGRLEPRREQARRDGRTASIREQMARSQRAERAQRAERSRRVERSRNAERRQARAQRPQRARENRQVAREPRRERRQSAGRQAFDRGGRSAARPRKERRERPQRQPSFAAARPERRQRAAQAPAQQPGWGRQRRERRQRDFSGGGDGGAFRAQRRERRERPQRQPAFGGGGGFDRGSGRRERRERRERPQPVQHAGFQGGGERRGGGGGGGRGWRRRGGDGGGQPQQAAQPQHGGGGGGGGRGHGRGRGKKD